MIVTNFGIGKLGMKSKADMKSWSARKFSLDTGEA